jgi:hypothetical protein
MKYRPVSNVIDRGKGYAAPDNFLVWLSKYSEIPLVSSELRRISGWYPVAFMKADEGFSLIMPLTSCDGENPLVNEVTGKWIGKTLPNIVKQYPYSLQPVDNGALGLCIDLSANEYITTSSEHKIFDNNGEITDFQKKLIEALSQRQKRKNADQDIIKDLHKKEILVPWELNLGNEGNPIFRDDLFTIDEKRLLEITQDDPSIFRNGGGNLIYGHLYSKTRLNLPGFFLSRKKKLEARLKEDKAKNLGYIDDLVFKPSDDLLDFSDILGG